MIVLIESFTFFLLVKTTVLHHPNARCLDHCWLQEQAAGCRSNVIRVEKLRKFLARSEWGLSEHDH